MPRNPVAWDASKGILTIANDRTGIRSRDINEMHPVPISGWFPVGESQVEGPFGRLTPLEKLLYWQLASRFNHAEGPFYCADLELAVSIGASVQKVREARRKFMALDWIVAIPGKQVRGKNLATAYSSVKWSIPGAEGYFSKIWRFPFEIVLSWLRGGLIDHADAALYVYLEYWWRRKTKAISAPEKVFVPVRLMEAISGTRNLRARLPKLSRWVYDYEPIFKWEDKIDEVLISSWKGFPDFEDDGAADCARDLLEDLEKRVSAVKEQLYRL